MRNNSAMQTIGISIHIGLNAVDPDRYDGWEGVLFGCENDALAYERIARNAGFATQTFLSKQATSEAVLGCLRRHSFEMVAGDLLFISFSGHGGSVPGFSHAEEAHDQTWCLYDRQVVDNELYEVFNCYARGVKILLFSDSCHSGTVTRYTGERTDFDFNEFKKLYSQYRLLEKKMPLEKVQPVFNKNKHHYQPLWKRKRVVKKDISAFVLLFAACQDTETAKEWGGQGLFTAAVCKALSTSICSYQELFLCIKEAIPSYIQNPNLFSYGNLEYDFSAAKPFVITNYHSK